MAEQHKQITINFSENDFVYTYSANGVIISSRLCPTIYEQNPSALALPYVAINVLVSESDTFSGPNI